ncbi:Beta-glucan synthesis-associated protein SKN1 [Hypsizygus marmoreus]|uniref:Beta-glucan synthesis-associated protein SKN1 n=1 Tax=Hypsizygus marmoreus TaxID=39966 RepID=A0A369JC11_HYPMA|nr:Beta-glucan synthesis-associated protein SKN1 [Hypsizygus marmoreus]
MSHTPRPRRGTPQPLPQEYAAVPQSPRSPRKHSSSSHYHSRPPVRNASVTSNNNNMPSGRGAIAAGVATGMIGAGYGPYSYHPDPNRDAGVYNASRFTTSPSEHSMITGPERAPVQQTNTVPQFLWDKDPDLDDALHNPDMRDGRRDNSFTMFSGRGWVNAIALFLLIVGLLMLFAGYPVIYHFTHPPPPITGFNLGGINATGQIPDLPGLPKLIDPETPSSALTRVGSDGKKYNLVFSDEFNTDGRTFYPGEDAFWEAADLHYWPTGDLEWYDPSAITTQDGKLTITLTEESTHDLNFKSGMLTSWNKLCFNTGYVEMSISMAGSPKAAGLWPGAWSMGNLGRAGYGASTEGMWPYSYDTCDIGTFPNQTNQDGTPTASSGLSFLPGQRLSACTCPGSDHPGPTVSVGRGVPEIDIIEAQVDTDLMQGQVSQSFQLAPYNDNYYFDNSSSATTIFNSDVTKFNSYRGGIFQQSVSAVSYIDDENYDNQGYAKYAYEWFSDQNQRSDGYIAWYSQGVPSWTVTAASVGPDPITQVSQRLIPEEPMYLVMNLGLAPGFQKQDYKHLKFPSTMYIDYVRIYQRQGTKNGITCNPPSRPTTDYINRHLQAYSNPNLTTWAQAGNTFPRNSLYHGC